MFNSARLKLTLWYLLIITLIVIVFSIGIYKGLTREFDRILRAQQLRAEWISQGQTGDVIGRFSQEAIPHRLDIQLIEESEARISLAIILVDLGILAASAFAGFFLAGRTLRPIEKMLDDQKRFTADASHELRTPLSALKSEIEVNLRDNKMTLSQAKKLLKSNLEEVDKLQALSDHLLALSRYQGFGTRLNFKQVFTAVCLEEATAKLSALARLKNLTISKSFEDATIEGDNKSLRELVIILLDNAVKFSSTGNEIMVSSEVIGNNLIVVVKDQGVGIEEKDLPNIFNRFYQADTSRNKDGQGFGLGLSIAKRIVELHHGSIEVTSKAGRGSTFTIKLPIKQYSDFINF